MEFAVQRTAAPCSKLLWAVFWVITVRCSQRPMRCLALLTALAATVAGLSTPAAPQAQSQWVYPGPDGQLVYKALPTGDKIMDFSHAGYLGGGVALPSVRPFDQGPPNVPEGILDAHGVPVTPPSLYLAQLAERLGPQALKNIGYGEAADHPPGDFASQVGRPWTLQEREGSERSDASARGRTWQRFSGD